jgi:hypothetical protein
MKKRIALNNNLFLDELVDPVTYFTEPDNGLSKIDSALSDIFQLLRDKYRNPIGINGWWEHLPQDMIVFDPLAFLDLMIKKKVPVWSGYRSALCKIGAKGSAHKLGKAEDPKGDEQAFFKIVCENAQQFYDFGLRRIENPNFTNGWLHADTETRNHKPGFIRIVNPSTGDERTSNKHAGDINVKTGEVTWIKLI